MQQVIVTEADGLIAPSVTLVQGTAMSLSFWEAVTTTWKHICFHQEPHFAENVYFHSSECG